MLKTIEHGQTKGPEINTRAENAETKSKKNNVNRETQVLKAIINQTRSIDNEFLVINIKAGPGQGCARCRVVLGASRLQDKTTISRSEEKRECPPLQPWHPGHRNGNEN